MSDRRQLDRLAGLLYGLAAVMFAGTFIELLAAKHVQQPWQLVPVALCVVGLGVVLAAWRRPSHRIVLALRWLVAVAFVASILGVWKHISGNADFVEEMHPGVTGMPLLLSALTGRAPLLASGALAGAAAVAALASVAAGASQRVDTPTLEHVAGD